MVSIYALILPCLLAAAPVERQDVAQPAESSDQRAANDLKEATADRLSDFGKVITPLFDAAPTLPTADGSGKLQAVAWVRLSREYLAETFERPVDRKKPVRDLILGTTISGESHTTGKTQLVLRANGENAQGELEFTGKVRSRTVGRNGPAILHYISDSTFRARKPLSIGEKGVVASAATATAQTRLTPTSIQSTLPRLRGRIARRIASRRVAETRSQADAIASDHTADDIRHDLDSKVNEAVKRIQAKVRSHIAALDQEGDGRAMRMRSRSTPEYIEVAVFQPGSKGEDLPIPTVAIRGNPDVAIRVHRSMLPQLVSDPELRQKFAPLLGSAVMGSPNDALPALAISGEWLGVDLENSPQKPSQTRVAVEGTPQRR